MDCVVFYYSIIGKNPLVFSPFMENKVILTQEEEERDNHFLFNLLPVEVKKKLQDCFNIGTFL